MNDGRHLLLCFPHLCVCGVGGKYVAETFKFRQQLLGGLYLLRGEEECGGIDGTENVTKTTIVRGGIVAGFVGVELRAGHVDGGMWGWG